VGLQALKDGDFCAAPGDSKLSSAYFLGAESSDKDFKIIFPDISSSGGILYFTTYFIRLTVSGDSNHFKLFPSASIFAYSGMIFLATGII
jgi:hypothetical protein